ncbi:MAG: glycolate oxidase subunit GlcE [Betaproteobacteria bacterium]|nr:glycolate oxidase subunit GlcE [Betaproteobacteria bacterium]
MSEALERFAGAVRAAAAAKRPLMLRGGGSKDFYGEPPQGEPLDTRDHAGIVDYDPSELVITARCGTPLAEIEAALAERGQMLAFEPPHFGGGATFGGMVAAGLSGPRRQAAGAVRDFLLGVRIMDARGEVLRFGGQVMKNVAGYDVSRLMAGALGTLGLIVDASIKTLPLPFAEMSVRLEMPEARAIESLNRWAGRPLPISASCHENDRLTLRLSGAGAAVRAAREALGGEALADGKSFWASVRDQTHPGFGGEAPLWRISVPSSAPALALPGVRVIEWGGALRWLSSNADPRTIREAARRAGGHATLFRSSDKSAGVFQPLDPALAKLHRNLKRAFDPEGIFNRGRMYRDF